MAIKEMVYKPRFTEPVILARDFYKGYEYIIISLGSHPCAYIALQVGQPYYNATNYDDVDIFCHGGCTFVERGDNFKPVKLSYSYNVIGWDYAHYNDFLGSYLGEEGSCPLYFNKRWTTKEIIEECKDVIEQLYILEHPELYYK